MKVLYATDLHGQTKKFEAILDIIDDHDIVILGADILPKGQHATESTIIAFIDSYLRKFFFNIDIPVIIDFGNDDWYMFYDLFKRTVEQFDNVFISHKNEIVIDDYSFIGLQYVPDYPFGIKDWCRIDGDKICDHEQFGTPYQSKSGEIKPISNLYKYLTELPSIEKELYDLPKPSRDKVVYIIHAPPIQSGLDVCFRSGPVGSKDVLNWILDTRPWLTLHGHIHESYEITKIAINHIHDTICINPGQKDGYGYKNFVWSEFNLDDVEGTFIRKEMKS